MSMLQKGDHRELSFSRKSVRIYYEDISTDQTLKSKF